jgi:hypothetical protein
MTSIDTNVSAITNKQYVFLRPHRSSTRCTTEYATISTRALTPNAKYGFFNHVPKIIWVLNFVYRIHIIHYQCFVKYHRRQDFVQT